MDRQEKQSTPMDMNIIEETPTSNDEPQQIQMDISQQQPHPEEIKFHLLTGQTRIRELNCGAVDLISYFGLEKHYELFCKKELPASLADAKLLSGVKGDRQIRIDEKMGLTRYLKGELSDSISIIPLDKAKLNLAVQMIEGRTMVFPEEFKGEPTIIGDKKDKKKGKGERNDGKEKDKIEKKEKGEHKNKEKNKDKDTNKGFEGKKIDNEENQENDVLKVEEKGKNIEKNKHKDNEEKKRGKEKGMDDKKEGKHKRDNEEGKENKHKKRKIRVDEENKLEKNPEEENGKENKKESKHAEYKKEDKEKKHKKRKREEDKEEAENHHKKKHHKKKHHKKRHHKKKHHDDSRKAKEDSYPKHKVKRAKH